MTEAQVFSDSTTRRVPGLPLLARLHNVINHLPLAPTSATGGSHVLNVLMVGQRGHICGLALAFTDGAGRGTIRTKPKGPVLENTFGRAVATPTASGVLSCPDFLGVSVFGRTYGFGRDGLVRKAGRTALPVFSTSRPPAALENVACGFESRRGAKTMTASPVASRSAVPTTTTITPDLVQLHLQACNALAQALHTLRNSECTANDLHRAIGRTLRAGTALKRMALEVTA